MSADFSSGVFLRGEGAWHGEGEVTTEQLTAAEAFTRANALFPVCKGNLWMGDPQSEVPLIQVSNRNAIYRADTNEVLSVVSNRYPIYPNTLLLRLAEAIEREADIDAVVVLAGGKRVCFTSRITGAMMDIVPGDAACPYIVGILGHDGLTALTGGYSHIRIVCRNTMQYAMNVLENQEGQGQATGFRFPHAHGFDSDDEAIAFIERQMDAIVAGINWQRQTFPQVVTGYRAMAQVDMSAVEFANFIRMVYKIPATMMIDGEEQPVTLEMAMPRKWVALQEAFRAGIGQDIDGVAGTLWAGFNAITQVESSFSPRAGRGSIARRLHATYCGAANNIIAFANQLAHDRIGMTAGEFAVVANG